MYMCALWWLALVVRYTSIIVKRFQSFLSPFLSLITCVHHTVNRRKKSRFRTIIDLLLLSLSFFLRVAWHNMRPIKWNKSSEASKEREKRERERRRQKGTERENLHTSNAHLYWIYILRRMWVFGVCIQPKNNILYILILVWHTYIFIYGSDNDYWLFTREVKPYVKRHHSPKDRKKQEEKKKKD